MFITVNREAHITFTWFNISGSTVIKKLFLYAIFLGLFNISGIAQGGKKLNADEMLRKVDSAKRTLIGKPFPDFSYTADNGIVYSTQKLLGTKYYINFWFESCHPCMEEMDALILLNTKLTSTSNKFISFTWDAPETSRRVKEEKKINFPVITVSREECSRLNFRNGFPTHIVVDEKGNIEYIGSSYKSNEVTINEITHLLTSKSAIQ